MTLERDLETLKALDYDVLSLPQLTVRFLESTMDTCGGGSSCATTADDGAHCRAYAMIREQLAVEMAHFKYV